MTDKRLRLWEVCSWSVSEYYLITVNLLTGWFIKCQKILRNESLLPKAQMIIKTACVVQPYSKVSLSYRTKQKKMFSHVL